MKKSLLIQIKKTFRRLNAINLLLIATASGLTYYSYDTLSAPPYEPAMSESSIPEPVNTSQRVLSKTVPANFASFETIPTNNLFRPERKEFVQPVEKAPPPPPPPPPRPEKRVPKPNLTLNGVMISGEKSKFAMISGNYFTSKSRVNLKYQRYKEGDVLGLYKVLDIDSKSVTLKDIKSQETLTLQMSFSSFSGGGIQKRNAISARARPQRTRRTRPPSRTVPQAPPPPPRRLNNRPEETVTSSKQTIPAVYVGGRVFYPKHGSPPPQRISGDLSSGGKQHISGN